MLDFSRKDYIRRIKMSNKFKKYIATFTAVFTILCCSTAVHGYMNNVNAGGGIWSYGVGTIGNIMFRQESKYYHKTKKHYANAMMNDKYTGRIKASKGKWANAYTGYYLGGWKTNRSYYGTY